MVMRVCSSTGLKCYVKTDSMVTKMASSAEMNSGYLMIGADNEWILTATALSPKRK